MSVEATRERERERERDRNSRQFRTPISAFVSLQSRRSISLHLHLAEFAFTVFCETTWATFSSLQKRSVAKRS
jgi:hypothetical protein